MDSISQTETRTVNKGDISEIRIKKPKTKSKQSVKSKYSKKSKKSKKCRYILIGSIIASIIIIAIIIFLL